MLIFEGGRMVVVKNIQPPSKTSNVCSFSREGGWWQAEMGWQAESRGKPLRSRFERRRGLVPGRERGETLRSRFERRRGLEGGLVEGRERGKTPPLAFR